ncbi:MAG: Mov34/MPN/PAD-1 family protein [Pirellulales bacterium]
MADNFDPPGVIVPVSALVSRRAQALAGLLERGAIAYAAHVEYRSSDKKDVVVLDVEVELGQILVHPIEQHERIAVIFDPADQEMPEVLALRKTFPDVPHINLRLFEFPRSLCLYDQPYSEIKSRWTPPVFVERIRTWLALTAKGKLHGDDQPLEPLLWGQAGHIVLPSDIFKYAGDISDQLAVTATSVEAGALFLIAEPDTGNPRQGGVPYVASIHHCQPQAHGIIRFKPSTLDQLAAFTAPAGLDILQELRTRIEEHKNRHHADKKAEQKFLQSRLVLIVCFPKTRAAGAPFEAADLWAFLTGKSVREIGIDIGLWTEIDGSIGREPFPPADRTGANIGLDLLNPVLQLDRAAAASLNGIELTAIQPNIAAIGAGALGSQVILNLARCGFGTWNVIDSDRLLPHNIARHGLPGFAVGFLKADSLVNFANSITDDGSPFTSRPIDVLHPGDQADDLVATFTAAAVILDMSASIAVAHELCHGTDSPARRISFFLNPTGRDSVLLAEDRTRNYQLDTLEMQYYRALIRSDNLSGHFVPHDARRRYGQSCRDVTTRIPQDCVAVHAAIGSRAVRQAIESPAAQISVWRTDEQLCVNRITIDPTPCVRFEIGNWALCMDTFALSTLHELRLEKLPNETGGVLIGSFDLDRRIAYVVDVLPSPPDSQEWPTLYIRGSRGLKARVKQIVAATDGALHYVGEWHSHPAGFSTAPSDDDLKVFAWLTERMDSDGLPALMMIVGDLGNVSSYLGKIERRENPLPQLNHGR